MYEQAAASGDTGALRSLEDLRRAALDLERAVREYWRAGGTNTAAVRELAGWRRRIGDREGAERLLRQAADGGDASALWRLAEIRAQDGDAEGAEQLYRHAVQADGTSALLELAQHCDALGDPGDAERLYRQAAEDGDARGLLELAALRVREGDMAGAERLYRQAAAAGVFAEAQLPHGLVLDGELVVWDAEAGRLSFEALQRRAATRARGALALAGRWRATSSPSTSCSRTARSSSRARASSAVPCWRTCSPSTP
ncbi:tetratricopeptide repeat protein [Streptomyces sp. NPDC090045]|uniref:tetratricopeptide repeat protein n=1 Tax=Streptomyces sp. NPDC090045 TaxID=3365927 RepID=UPI003806EFC4